MDLTATANDGYSRNRPVRALRFIRISIRGPQPEPEPQPIPEPEPDTPQPIPEPDTPQPQPEPGLAILPVEDKGPYARGGTIVPFTIVATNARALYIQSGGLPRGLQASDPVEGAGTLTLTISGTPALNARTITHNVLVIATNGGLRAELIFRITIVST